MTCHRCTQLLHQFHESATTFAAVHALLQHAHAFPHHEFAHIACSATASACVRRMYMFACTFSHAFDDMHGCSSPSESGCRITEATASSRALLRKKISSKVTAAPSLAGSTHLQSASKRESWISTRLCTHAQHQRGGQSQTKRETKRERKMEREGEREGERERQRQTEIERDRQRQTETDIDRQRQTDTGTDQDRQGQAERRKSTFTACDRMTTHDHAYMKPYTHSNPR